MKIKANELVEDFDLYPRMEVNSAHVTHIAEAIESGAVLPPIIACAKSKRVVDGFHRRRANVRLFGDEAEVEVELRTYKTEADILLDALRLNSEHGRNMSTADRMHSLILAEKVGLSDAKVAVVLHVRPERIAEFKKLLIVRVEGTRTRAVLKVPIRHMTGRQLTKEQAEVIPSLGGNHQLFLVNQLVTLIETGMLDAQNETLMARLRLLGAKISDL